MAPPPPKAILFDIGGVCVLSPFQAILTYERTHNIPIGYINFAIQKGPLDTGAWQVLERGEVPLDDAWFASFKAQLSRPKVWTAYMEKLRAASDESTAKVGAGLEEQAPPVPTIDAKKLFWEMMRISRTPDPYMYPALRRLKQSGQFVIGALSNTIDFPAGILDDRNVPFDTSLFHDAAPSNPYAADSRDIRTCFDAFVSSAHVGVRKPDPEAYAVAVRELSKVSVERGLGEVRPEEVVFLDDIGGNLKGAKKCGLRTIKVNLGRTREAVKELEGVVGFRLGGAERGRL